MKWIWPISSFFSLNLALVAENDLGSKTLEVRRTDKNGKSRRKRLGAQQVVLNKVSHPLKYVPYCLGSGVFICRAACDENEQ